MVLCAMAAPINVRVTIPSLGLTNAPGTIDGIGTKVSEYPNVSLMHSNYLILLASPSDHTNYNVAYGQLAANFLSAVDSLWTNTGETFTLFDEGRIHPISTTNFDIGTNGDVVELNGIEYLWPSAPPLEGQFLMSVSSAILAWSNNITLLVTEEFFSSNAFITNLTVQNITNVTEVTSNLFSTNIFVSNAYITNLYTSNAYITNLTVQFITNLNTLITSNLFTTNLFATNLYVTNITANKITVQNIFSATNFFGDVTVTNGITNLSLNASQFVATDGGKQLVSTLNGSTLTNLTYKYTTNAINTGSFAFGKEWTTNVSGNIVLGAFTLGDTAAYESMVIWVTNTGASVFSITLPNGVQSEGQGRPPVYYSTNGANQDLKILVEHTGVSRTNSSAQHYW